MMLEVNLEKTTLGISFVHSKPLTKMVANRGLAEPYCRTTKCVLFGITHNQTIKLAEGVSRCSWLDNFRKSTGRKLALARALSALTGLTREERKKVWEAYLSRPRCQTTLSGTVCKDVSGNIIEGL